MVGAHLEVPVAGWAWNPQEQFAYAPGVSCFVAGQEYAHGGASLQECLVPVLTLNSTTVAAGVTVKTKEIQWSGLRCRVSVEPAIEGLRADLRTKPNKPDSSVVESQKPKALNAHGKVSLLVTNESLIGTMVSVVILDASGRVVCKEPTTVGGDE